MTDESRNGSFELERDLVSPRVRQQRASVERGERLQHSGVLDMVSALGTAVGFFFLPEAYDAASAAVLDLARLLLGVATGVLLLRGVLRLANYWNT